MPESPDLAERIQIVFRPEERRLFRVAEIYGWKLSHWSRKSTGLRLFFSRGSTPPDVLRVPRGKLLLFARSLLAGKVDEPRGVKPRSRLYENSELALDGS